MLTCKEQVARSSDYLDGQLSFGERLMVRHHLMFCRNCRRFPGCCASTSVTGMAPS